MMKLWTANASRGQPKDCTFITFLYTFQNSIGSRFFGNRPNTTGEDSVAYKRIEFLNEVDFIFNAFGAKFKINFA